VITRVADIPAAVFSQFNDEILATLSEEQLAQITLEQRAQIPTSQPVNSAACDITKQGQTIDFSMLLDKSIGAENVTLQAKSSSGLEVDFSLDKTSLGCSLVNDNQVKILAEGICVINAYQNGSLQFNPAPVQTQRFRIVDSSLKKDQDMTVTVTDTNQKALFVLQVTDELGNSITQAHSQVFSSHSENTDPAMPMSIAQPDKGKVNLRFTVKAAPNDVGKNAGLKIRARIENKWMTLTTLNGWQEVESAYETIKLPSYEMDYSLFSGALLPGTYPIELSYTTDAGDTAKANFEFTMIESVQRIEPIAQIIHWELSAGGGVVGEKLNVTVTGGESGEPVKIVGITDNVCLFSGDASAGWVELIAEGECVLKATQAGNENYSETTSEQEIFSESAGVFSLKVTDALGHPTSLISDTDKVTIAVALTPRIRDVDQTANVYLYISDMNGQRYSPTTPEKGYWRLEDGSPISTLTLSNQAHLYPLHEGTIPAGNYEVHASYQLTGTEVKASSVLNVKRTQVITVDLPAKPVAGSWVHLQPTQGTSGNPLQFSSTPESVCVVEQKPIGMILRFIAEGSCELAISQAGNASHTDAVFSRKFDVASAGLFSLEILKDQRRVTEASDKDTLDISLSLTAPDAHLGQKVSLALYVRFISDGKVQYLRLDSTQTWKPWDDQTPLLPFTTTELKTQNQVIPLYHGTLPAADYEVVGLYKTQEGNSISVPSVLKINKSGQLFYVSPTRNGKIDGVEFERADILVYDEASRRWSMFFDASDVRLGRANVDAFTITPKGTLLLSVSSRLRNFSLEHQTVNVDDADIIEFVPKELGETTSGYFRLYLSDKDIGLNDNSDIDALTLLPDGRVLFSLSAAWNNIHIRREDMLAFTPSSGKLELYFDGSDIDLRSGQNNINGIIDMTPDGSIYLKMLGGFITYSSTTKIMLDNFAVRSFTKMIIGSQKDILVCTAPSLGTETGCDSLYKIQFAALERFPVPIDALLIK